MMRFSTFMSVLCGLICVLSSKPLLAEQVLAPPLSRIKLTSGFGPRHHPIRKVARHHDGVDLAAPIGTPIFAVLGGQVAFAGWFGGYGKLVVILHSDGKSSHYAHCRSFNVQVGDLVRRGDLIGKVGRTGAVTGPHLHFEIREGGEPLDPRPYLSEYFDLRKSPLS